MKLRLPINLRHFAMACTFVATTLSASAVDWDAKWSEQGSAAAPELKSFTTVPEDYTESWVSTRYGTDNFLSFVFFTYNDFKEWWSDDSTLAVDINIPSAVFSAVVGGLDIPDLDEEVGQWSGGRRDVWMNFSGSTVHSVVGGDLSISGDILFGDPDEPSTSTEHVFEGDVHIQVQEGAQVTSGKYTLVLQDDPQDPYGDEEGEMRLAKFVCPLFDHVSNVTGGNVVAGLFGKHSTFKGNSYVSFSSTKSGSVVTTGNHLAGVGTFADYMGNTYLNIYNVQQKNAVVQTTHEGLSVSVNFVQSINDLFDWVIEDAGEDGNQDDIEYKFFTDLKTSIGEVLTPDASGEFLSVTWENLYHKFIPDLIPNIIYMVYYPDMDDDEDVAECEKFVQYAQSIWSSIEGNEESFDMVKQVVTSLLSIITLNSTVDSFIGGNTVSVGIGSVASATGNSSIWIDLEGRKGDFGKKIVGGDFVNFLMNHAVRTGDTTVAITNAGDVNFTERVVGGSRSTGLHTSLQLKGNSNVLIDSGNFQNVVIGGMNSGDLDGVDIFAVAGRVILDGTSNVAISGGKYEGYKYSFAFAGSKAAEEKELGNLAVVGGNLVTGNIERDAVNVITEGVNMEISGGEFAGHIIGSTAVLGRVEDFSKVDIHVNGPTNVTMTGGTMDESTRLVGGMMLHTTQAPTFSLSEDLNEVIEFISTIDLEQLDEGEEEYIMQFIKDAVEVGLPPVAKLLTSLWQSSINSILDPAAKLTPAILKILFSYDFEYELNFDLAGFKIDDYEGDLGITVGDVNVTVGGNAVVYDVVGGSWVGCAVAPNNEVKQGAITVNLGKGATILGNVYAGGIQSGDVALVTKSTEVNIENGVTFAEGSIVSGGYLNAEQQEEEINADAFSTWRKNASVVEEDRTLNLKDAADYGDSLAKVTFTNFDVVDVNATDAKVGALQLTDTQGGTRNKVTITGGGQLSIVPEMVSITTQEMQEDGTLSEVTQEIPNLAAVIVPGATLRIAMSDSTAAVGTVQSVEVKQDGRLLVDLVGTDGSRRNLEVVDSLSFSENGTLEMRVKLENSSADEAFISKAEGGSSSSTVVLDGAQISLDIVNNNADDIVDANGKVNIVLVDKVLGGVLDVDYTLTDLTKEQIARLFTEKDNVGVIVDEKGQLVLTNVEEVKKVTPNEHYYEDSAQSGNGAAGGQILDDFFYNREGNEESPDRDKVLESALASNAAGNTAESDRLMAAVAGASLSTLGSAAADDLDRQLRLVRNRVQRHVDAVDGQRRTVWVNAEGDHRDLDAKSTDPGYKMNSWGGTLGVGYTTRRNIDLGLAISAMYGDLKSDGPDKVKADTDTCYLSGFAQMKRGKWTHTFVATAGLTNLDGERTVEIGNGYGSYTTEFETDGYLLGAMYEVGRSIYLNEAHTSYIQPVANVAWRHVALDGFTESGSDAALSTGDQTLDTVVAGAGLRIGGQAGRRTLNRTVQLEGRALVKAYMGDKQNKVEVGFADRAARSTVKSREQSSVGVELGGSASLPLRSRGRKARSLYLDANAELRGDYTNLNATLGYKVQF